MIAVNASANVMRLRMSIRDVCLLLRYFQFSPKFPLLFLSYHFLGLFLEAYFQRFIHHCSHFEYQKLPVIDIHWCPVWNEHRIGHGNSKVGYNLCLWEVYSHSGETEHANSDLQSGALFWHSGSSIICPLVTGLWYGSSLLETHLYCFLLEWLPNFAAK